MDIVQNILNIAKENHMTNQQLCKLLQTNPNKIYDWKRGKSKPSADDLYIIAQYFNVSADSLLGRSDKIKSTDDSGYDQLDDIDKAEIRGMIRQMLKADKYKEELPQYIESKVAARGGGVMTHTMTKEELEKANAETTEFEGFDELQKF